MNLRKKRLINPGFQLRLVAIFLCSAAFAVQAEAILTAYTLARLSEQMPNDGNFLLAKLPEFVSTNLLITFAFLAPLMLGVGIVATFPIAGPLYRFEQFLKAVKEGKQIEPCSVRKGDELQKFCTLLNEVTEPLRERSSAIAKAATEGLESIAPAIPSIPSSTSTVSESLFGASTLTQNPRRSPSDHFV